MPTPSVLDSRIRSLVTELIESAPEAPTIQELERREFQALRGRGLLRARPFVLVGSVAALVAAILVVALLLPVVTPRTPAAKNLECVPGSPIRTVPLSPESPRLPI